VCRPREPVAEREEVAPELLQDVKGRGSVDVVGRRIPTTVSEYVVSDFRPPIWVPPGDAAS
jgi:hypothetical protein